MLSINTNVGALIAQRFLREVNESLTITQNRLSSGLRVSSVTDDASTFAVAAGMRGDLKAYTAVTSALQGGVVAAQVAVSAGETISERLGDVQAKIVQLSNGSLTAKQRDIYNADLQSMVAEVNSYLQQAGYAGYNLLGTGGSDLEVIANIDGSTLSVRNNNVAALDIDEINNNGDANQALADLANFTASLDTALANLGADITRIDRQTEFVQRTEETVRIGLGSLVDADIGRETAMLNSLTARQELAVEAIGIANSLPRILLDLFRT